MATSRDSVPLVSIVIPNVNGASVLEACLASLRKQRFRDYEIVVVDNGSDDHSLELLARQFQDVRVVRLSENKGFGKAANIGARASRGAYLAFLNNDTFVDPDWLVELFECLERHPAASSVAAKVMRMDDPATIDGAGDSMTWSLKAYRRGFGEDADRYLLEAEVFSASATACLWRSEVFFELGGFDESFFAYYEDVDLGFRARLAGYECWYAPGASVLHVGSATARSSWPSFNAFHSVANRWRMIVKNAPLRWLLLNLHSLVTGEVALLARAAASGDARLVLRGYGLAARSFSGLLRERRRFQASRPVTYRTLTAVVDRRFPPLQTSLRRSPTSRVEVDRELPGAGSEFELSTVRLESHTTDLEEGSTCQRP